MYMQLKECMKLECKVGIRMENNINKKNVVHGVSYYWLL